MIRYKITDLNDGSFFINRGNYRLYYKDGDIVTAPEKTLGIMLFDNLENAKTFLSFNVCGGYKIKEVECLGDEIDNPKVCNLNGLNGIDKNVMLCYFYNKEKVIKLNSPIGTICCKKIKVLKTILVKYYKC